MYALETGKTGFEKANGKPFFEYLAQHPEEASHFSDAMVGFHGSEPPTVAAAYDFSARDTIVDVGGATGDMSRPSCLAMPRRAACCSTCRTSCEMRRRC